jgi:hypothetical protein
MQKQHDILVHFSNGTQDNCVRTGNNAPWLCPCGRRLPLVGYSDELTSLRECSKVICPECNRVYRVVAPSFRRVPTHVQEIST